MRGAYAFLVSFLAGAATSIGGLGAIWASRALTARGFAVTLAFAAGVMTFVSFVEIYAQGTEYLTHSFQQKIKEGPNKENLVKGAALSVGMALFFVGWLIANLMDCLVQTCMDQRERLALRKTRQLSSPHISAAEDIYPSELLSNLHAHTATTHTVMTHAAATTHTATTHAEPHRSSASASPSPMTVGRQFLNEDASVVEVSQSDTPPNCLTRFWHSAMWRNFVGINDVDLETQEHVKRIYAEDCAKMTRLGYFTALVLTLHNFPEGIATFTSSAADAKMGIGLGVAIGIHNIPEGIAVAVPILIGTGSKWKAFLYSTISGMAEPLGGLLTWLALGDHQGNMLMGVIFLVIAGIMVNVSVKELLFAAIRYDPGNVVTSFAYTAGMFIMALSLTGLYLA